MPLPAFVLPTVGSFILKKGLGSLFGGGGQGVPNTPSANPLNDSAIRASMISQGLADPTGNVPGSNVPDVRTNQPSLANTISGGMPGIPTRNAIGLGGDEALMSSANVYRQQLARQLGTEITNINREFSTAGRFDSGQRLEAIGRAQQGSREQFGRFFSSTALERFLQQQRLEAQAEIARAELEGRKGAGRTQLFATGISALSNIVAQNPQFFMNLITRSGSEGFSSAPNPLEQYFDPNATTIQPYG